MPPMIGAINLLNGTQIVAMRVGGGTGTRENPFVSDVGVGIAVVGRAPDSFLNDDGTTAPRIMMVGGVNPAGVAVPIMVDALGQLLVSGISGGGGGGGGGGFTYFTFGDTFPTAGMPIGFLDGLGQMVPGRIDPNGYLYVTGRVNQRIFADRAVIATPGTAVYLPGGGSNSIRSITIKALLGNAGVIYVGGQLVTSSDGLELEAGDSISIDFGDLSQIYINGPNAGDGVSFLCVKE